MRARKGHLLAPLELRKAGGTRGGGGALVGGAGGQGLGFGGQPRRLLEVLSRTTSRLADGAALRKGAWLRWKDV